MIRHRTLIVFLVGVVSLGFLPGADMPRRGGADVHIVFSGLVCHVFAENHSPCAVTMRGTEAMPHRATLSMQRWAITSSDIALACDNAECALDLTNVAIRFPAAGGRATYERGGSFDTIVPHLRAVTNGEMAVLRPDVFDEVPSPSGAISSSIELPAGSLTATSEEALGHYEPDFENRGDRPFAREVFLDGHIDLPQILVRRFGDQVWHRITFRADADVELRIANVPAVPMGNLQQHDLSYYELSNAPLAFRPVIALSVPTPRHTAPDITPSVGCTNSQWP